mgnify:CR=1 FL=1
MQYKFHLNNLRMAPRKTRLIANLIKKMPALQAEAQLQFQKKTAALPILKLLKSGVASTVHNFNLSPENLYILNIFVDEGPMLKRFRPRAFGRAGAIHKKTSHITLILEEKFVPGAKNRKKIIKEIKPEKPSFLRQLADTEGKEKIEMTAPKEIKPKNNFRSFTRRIFKRKVIE